MTLVYLDGPKPPANAHLGWCMFCAMVLRGLANDELGDQMASLATDGIERTKRLGMPKPGADYPLEPAVAYGLIPQWSVPQMGVNGNGTMPFPVPLCWTHLLGVSVSTSRVTLQPGTSADAAALDRMARAPRGPGGAALLGGG